MFISEMKVFQKLIKNKSYLILTFIIAFAIFLRFYNISFVPPSPSLDEVSIGYNAYSILKTNVDEFGTHFPILLRAYDDWRPALYVYLVIPFVKFLGLNVFSVRLPAVILSVITVIATYFLVKQLLTKRIALVTSFLLAISPWNIYISRLGHEANAGLTFLVLGVLFFIKAIKGKFLLIYLSFVFFAFSFMSYQSEKFFVPLLVLGLIFIYREKILKNKKYFLLASILALLLITPFIKATFEPNALIRFKATNVFESNRKVIGIQLAMKGYISHFNPTWLFSNPSSDRHKVPGLGLFYIWEAPFLLFGLGLLFFGKFEAKIKPILLLWLFLSPLPAAITTDAPHAVRIYQALPVPQIFISLGIVASLDFSRKYRRRFYIFSLLVFLVIAILSMVYFYKQYFNIFPKKQSSSFQYALSKVISFVLANQDNYKKIIFSNEKNLYQSYMFFLFFSFYDPFLYQKQGGTKSGGFAESHSFGKYTFRRINWNKETEKGLYIGNISDFPIDIGTKKTIVNLDGLDAIKIVEKN